jgi:hydrogenase/urease accessory protein HupE
MPARTALAALSFLAATAGAHAHHASNLTPQTFAQALSGLAHPVIGLDHFASSRRWACSRRRFPAGR